MSKDDLKLNSIDWNDLLSHYQSHATSEVAREKIAETSALATSQDASESFKEIFEFQEFLSGGERPLFESLDLAISWLPRLEKEALLKPLELKDIRLFLLETEALRELLASVPNSTSEKVRGDLIDVTEPLSAIDQLLAPGGEIRTDASETLYKLTNEKNSLAQQIDKSLTRLVKENELESVLQDRFVTNREGRWVVPVKSGKRHDLPGIIHGSSHSKQTVFTEPQEVVPLNNRLKRIDVEIEEEIERLLRELSSFLHLLYDEFKTTRYTLTQTDVRFAQAQVSTKLKAEPVKFGNQRIHLQELRHPLLSLSSTNVVSNDVELDQDNPILLLSGPNAGGKTVLLKSIGLASQMARCGLPICASSSSELPFFTNISVSVGDNQSVDQHLSTFAAHLKDLNSCLSAKGPGNLILIDEMCGSTDPEEGGALARSFIESYAANKVFTVVTSHLGPLKTGWSPDAGVTNGSLEYDNESGLPTYRFIHGISGKSLAIQTARRVGVATEVVDSAIKYMSLESQERLSETDTMEAKKVELEALEKKYRKLSQEADRERQRYQKLLKQLDAEAKEEIKRKVDKAQAEIDSLVSNAKVNQIFRKFEDVQDLKRNVNKVVVMSSSETSINSAEEFAKKYPLGSQVFIPSLKKVGVVQSTPNSKGEVSVLSESMRLQLSWKSLESPQSAPQSDKKVISRGRSLSHVIEHADPTVDLRGKRVEEAIESLEVELDSAAHRQLDRMKIIHGHGTDALKKAVRSHLSRSTYVTSWQAGSPNSGGDGITWVSLN